VLLPDGFCLRRQWQSRFEGKVTQQDRLDVFVDTEPGGGRLTSDTTKRRKGYFEFLYSIHLHREYVTQTLGGFFFAPVGAAIYRNLLRHIERYPLRHLPARSMQTSHLYRLLAKETPQGLPELGVEGERNEGEFARIPPLGFVVGLVCSHCEPGTLASSSTPGSKKKSTPFWMDFPFLFCHNPVV
jgi:hypothetical protein